MPGRGVIAASCAVAAAGLLVTVPPLVSPLRNDQVRLTGVDDGDSPLGDGTALSR